MTHPTPASLAGLHIDYPRLGDRPGKYSLDVVGWVVGAAVPVKRIEVRCESFLVRAADVWMPRPDVAGHFREQPGMSETTLTTSATSGFHAAVSVIGLPPRFDLRVEAVLADGSRSPLGAVCGMHDPLNASLQPRLQPVISSHLPRSGSTWLMQMLAGHPGIAVHRRYPFEACVAVHAMRTFQTLSAPCNPPQKGDVAQTRTATHSVSALPFYCAHEDPHMHAWLREEHVERFARFTLDTVDAFYAEVASTQGKAAVQYFGEKVFTSNHIAGTFAELYGGLKEVFLVRDFRDVTCSGHSFFNRGVRADAGHSLEEQLMGVRQRLADLLTGWRSRSSKAHVMRYEDLVRNTGETLRALLDYLDLDSSPELVNELMEKTRNTPERELHQTSGDALRSIGRWRRDMNAAHQALAHEHLGEGLREFGYDDG